MNSGLGFIVIILGTVVVGLILAGLSRLKHWRSDA